MDNALDAFRAQQVVAERLYEQLVKVESLVRQLRGQVDAVAHHQELRALLTAQEGWLARSTQLVGEVHRLRELDRLQYRPGIVRRWIVALGFALASAAAAGAGYGWVAEPYTPASWMRCGARPTSGDSWRTRRLAMTPSRRRQLDTLLQLTARLAMTPEPTGAAATLVDGAGGRDRASHEPKGRLHDDRTRAAARRDAHRAPRADPQRRPVTLPRPQLRIVGKVNDDEREGTTLPWRGLGGGHPDPLP